MIAQIVFSLLCHCLQSYAGSTCVAPAGANLQSPRSGCSLTLTLYTSLVTWPEARWACENKDRQLARMDFYTHQCLLQEASNPGSTGGRQWTGVYNATPGSVDFTRGDCEPLDWSDWTVYQLRPLPTSSCVTTEVTSLQWKPQKCSDKEAFLCESWEWSDPRSCFFKSTSLSCVWDAEHTFSPMDVQFCQSKCDSDRRCWGYIESDFRVTNGSFDVITSVPGCTMILADHLSTCSQVYKSYSITLRFCYEYTVVANPLGRLPSLPDEPSKVCGQQNTTDAVPDTSLPATLTPSAAVNTESPTWSLEGTSSNPTTSMFTSVTDAVADIGLPATLTPSATVTTESAASSQEGTSSESTTSLFTSVTDAVDDTSLSATLTPSTAVTTELPTSSPEGTSSKPTTSLFTSVTDAVDDTSLSATLTPSTAVTTELPTSSPEGTSSKPTTSLFTSVTDAVADRSLPATLIPSATVTTELPTSSPEGTSSKPATSMFTSAMDAVVDTSLPATHAPSATVTTESPTTSPEGTSSKPTTSLFTSYSNGAATTQTRTGNSVITTEASQVNRTTQAPEGTSSNPTTSMFTSTTDPVTDTSLPATQAPSATVTTESATSSPEGTSSKSTTSLFTSTTDPVTDTSLPATQAPSATESATSSAEGTSSKPTTSQLTSYSNGSATTQTRTANPVITTAASQVIRTTQAPAVKTKRLCDCPCNQSVSSPASLQQALQDAHKLETTLRVPKATLSATRRKKESAPDPRASARYTGYVGVAVIGAVCLSVVLSDLHTLFLYVTSR